MGTRRLIARGLAALALTSVSADALAQTYPYFPPPGTSYASSTWTSTGATALTFAGYLTVPAGPAAGSPVAQIIPSLWTASNINSIEIAVGATPTASATGTTLCASPDTASTFYENSLTVSNTADFIFCSGDTNAPYFVAQFPNTGLSVGGFLVENNNFDGPSITSESGSHTRCNQSIAGFHTPKAISTPCSDLDSDGVGATYPLVITVKGQTVALGYFAGNANEVWLGVGGTTPTLTLDATSTGTNQATVTLGDTHSSSTTTIKGGGSTFSYEVTSAGLLVNGITTGTNADFLCMSSANVLLIQSSSCTISALRFKENLKLLDDASAVLKLHPQHFTYKQSEIPNRDPNYVHPQVGLIADEVAKVLPECAVYENDMKTPKSYRPECITAFLVKVAQDHQRYLESNEQTIESYHRQLVSLFAICFSIITALIFHAVHLHVRVRRFEKAT